MAKVIISKPKKRKIGPKIIDDVLSGYAPDSNVNRFLVVNSEISEISNNTIIEVRDIVYFENIYPFKFRAVNHLEEAVNSDMLIKCGIKNFNY